jgi:hypothetical protein
MERENRKKKRANKNIPFKKIRLTGLVSTYWAAIFSFPDLAG